MSADGIVDRLLAHLQALGLVLMCGVLGLHPAQVPVAVVLVTARAGVRRVAHWGGHHLSWALRGRGSRASDLEPTIGRKVALWR
jgi:hypothetical protein